MEATKGNLRAGQRLAKNMAWRGSDSLMQAQAYASVAMRASSRTYNGTGRPQR
jgi:hypothetical protein